MSHHGCNDVYYRVLFCDIFFQTFAVSTCSPSPIQKIEHLQEMRISRRILHKRYGHQKINRSVLTSSDDVQSLHTQASIVGAGLAGSLLAVYLRRRGYSVDVFEKLEDMRKCTEGGGRSINLVLTSRGLHALDQVGLKETVENITVPVYGRALHSVDGEVVMYVAFSLVRTTVS